MNERKAKGVVANGYLKFIKRKWGIEGMRSAREYAGIPENLRDGDWISMKKTESLRLFWNG